MNKYYQKENNNNVIRCTHLDTTMPMVLDGSHSGPKLSLSLSLFYGPKGKRENATILIHTLKPTPFKIHTVYSIPLPQYIQNLPKSTGMYVEFYILVVVKSFSACHCVKNNCFFVFSLPFYSFPPSLSGPYFSVLPG